MPAAFIYSLYPGSGPVEGVVGVLLAGTRTHHCASTHGAAVDLSSTNINTVLKNAPTETVREDLARAAAPDAPMVVHLPSNGCSITRRAID